MISNQKRILSITEHIHKKNWMTKSIWYFIDKLRYLTSVFVIVFRWSWHENTDAFNLFTNQWCRWRTDQQDHNLSAVAKIIHNSNLFLNEISTFIIYMFYQNRPEHRFLVQKLFFIDYEKFLVNATFYQFSSAKLLLVNNN